MDEHIFKDSKNVDFENPVSPFDDGKESLGCLPPNFDTDLALIPGLTFNDVDTMDFHFPSLDSQDIWKEIPGFMLPDFEIELKKFTSNAEAMKETAQDNFRNIISPFDYAKESLSGKESLGIIQIENLDISFGESCLNPLNDERDLIKRLNTAYIFNTSTGYDISSGTQTELPAPRRIIRSEPDSLPSSTTTIYSLTKSPLLTRYTLDSNVVHSSMYDSVFKEELKISPCKSTEETSGNLSCIVKDSDSVYLDCTPQPDWPSDLETSSKENTKLQTTDVFKKIDKKIPSSAQLQDQKTTGTVLYRHEDNDHRQIISVTNNMEKHETSDSPEELLEMISKILSKSNISVEQKSKGQMMILQLSEILCSIKPMTSDSAKQSSSKCATNDSGNGSKQHSQSFEKDKYEVYEVLDLSRKSCNTPKQEMLSENAVNLSVISNNVKRNIRSFSQPIMKSEAVERHTSVHEIKVNKDNCKTTVKVNVIKPSPPSTTSWCKIQAKLNSKPNNITQKGPLKAVLPVRDMKRGSSITPEKPVVLSTRKVKTPAQDSKLKPLAASTPTIANGSNVTPKIKTSVAMESSCNSNQPLVANSGNRNSKQSSCLIKKDINFPPSRTSLSTYNLSNSKPRTNYIPRRSLPVTSMTNKVQKPKKVDKENIHK